VKASAQLGPGTGANSEMDDPEPLTPNADATARKKYEEQLLRAQLLRNMPTRSGGMGLSVPEGETDACFLSGRASFPEHMRSYSVPWRLAMEKHMLDKTTAEGKAIDEALKALKEQTGGDPDSPTDQRCGNTSSDRKKLRLSRYCLEQSKPNSTVTVCLKAALTQDSETGAATLKCRTAVQQQQMGDVHLQRPTDA